MHKNPEEDSASVRKKTLIVLLIFAFVVLGSVFALKFDSRSIINLATETGERFRDVQKKVQDTEDERDDVVSGMVEETDDQDVDGESVFEIAAFPGCQGPGCTATGGRGGEVYLVTNTNDSGLGSLRDALEASGDRYIVGATDGIIENAFLGPDVDDIHVTSGNVTIDFCNPPGEGITMHRQPILFDKVDNVIVKCLRYRGGPKILDHDEQAPGDALTFRGTDGAAVWRADCYGWTDECVDFERAPAFGINENFTIQDSIFWPGCFTDCQEGFPHARPTNWSRGWDNGAFIGNASIGNERRQPQLNGCDGHPQCEGKNWPLNPKGLVAGNLVAFWDKWATHCNFGAQCDIIGNVFKPASWSDESGISTADDQNNGTAIYLSANIAETSLPFVTQVAERLTPWDFEIDPISVIGSESWFRDRGTFVWDDEDERLLNLYLTDNFTFSTMAQFDPDTYTPPVPSKGSYLDADEDGIPDSIDPKPNTFSAWEDTNGDGWSDLEAYHSHLSIN